MTEMLQADGRFDVSALDKVVTMMNRGSGQAQKEASDILARFKENPDSWTRVDAIFEFSSLLETKYFALQILEQLIQTRWKALPREQCEGIKGYIVTMVLEISGDTQKSESMKLLLQKLNLVLVQIVKQEWPRLWPTFITDIVGSSRSAQSVCMNNMTILRLLSEEVFEFGSGLTSARAIQLKQQFCGQFEEVYKLCQEILENSDDARLVHATLLTLHGFLNWIPIGYVFENNLIDLITTKFLPYPAFRSIAIQCLIEISSIPIEDNPQYGFKLLSLLRQVMDVIALQLPLNVDFVQSYADGTDDEQTFISNLAQLLVTFLKEHSKVVEVLTVNPIEEREKTKEVHMLALSYLLKITQIEDVEVLKICLDYWNWLCLELFHDSPFNSTELPLIDSLRKLREDNSDTPRRKLYAEALSELRLIMISRMAKPEEVIVVINENNEAVRELVKDTDSLALYKTMRETLVYLTHLDYQDTEQKMSEKLRNQVNGTEFSWKNLNTLCWAIGSISGAMYEDVEKRFLVTVVRDLLGLCEKKRGKDNKAVIASNIMYVVGQYPRFLRVHWKFLKTVINKLFEFMHESHEGVQDMACDTFIKIIMKCRQLFITIQPGERMPFVNEILQNLNGIICDLSQAQVHVFYEAVGLIIYCETQQSTQEQLIESLMMLPNSMWKEAVELASQDVAKLTDVEVLRNLVHILKTNVAACRSIGSPFFTQLKRILHDMLSVYQVTSGNLNKAVSEHGDAILKQPLLKTMRVVKKEILTLLSVWIAHAFEAHPEVPVISSAIVNEHVIQPLLLTVLADYAMNVPAAREPKVLSLLSISIVSLKEDLSPQVPAILDAVFECTLGMINKDMEVYPVHRTNFFHLLSALNTHCFNVIISLPGNVFILIIQAIVYAFKHSMRDVAGTGIGILKDLLTKVSYPENKMQAQRFYQNYYMTILEHVLSVVTDHNQVPFVGLTNLAETVCLLFQAGESSIELPLNIQNPSQPNMDFIGESVTALFNSRFSKNLTDAQIRVTIKGFFSYNRMLPQMREHIRDFLVQIKEEAGEDTSDLFLEEKETEIQRVQNEKRAIPGVTNPNDIIEEGANMR